MSEKEQKAAAKRELDKLKKQQENQPAPNELQVVALQPMGAVKSNWYFYNNNLIFLIFIFIVLEIKVFDF